MNRPLISYALSQIDEDLIAEAMGSRSRASERKLLMNQQSERRVIRLPRRVAVLALAACLLLALSVTAYAANWFGLRELFANDNRGEMPDGAAELIVSQDAAAEGEGWDALVLESYCDMSTVLVTVRVRADESYLVAPTDEGPNSPLWTIGLEGEGTLGEYAAAHGKKLLLTGAALDQAPLGLSPVSERFESASPQEMTILIEASRSESSAVTEGAVTVHVVPYDPATDEAGEVERLTLPVTLAEGNSELIGVYTPDDTTPVDGIELGELRLTRTPLGISMQLEIRFSDPVVMEQFLTVRLEGVEFYGNGYVDPETGLAEFSQGQGEIADKPRITLIDWDKESLGSVSFSKIG